MKASNVTDDFDDSPQAVKVNVPEEQAHSDGEAVDGAVHPYRKRHKPVCNTGGLVLVTAIVSFAMGMKLADPLLGPNCPNPRGTSEAAPLWSTTSTTEAAQPPTLAPLLRPAIEQQAQQVAADYGFLYTPEGMKILADLSNLGMGPGGPPAALAEAERLMESNSHFLHACHPLLHRLGRRLFMANRSHGLAVGFRDLVPFHQGAEAAARSLMSLEAQKPKVTWSSPQIDKEKVRLLMSCNAAYLHGILELFLSQAGLIGNGEAAVRFLDKEVCGRMNSGFGYRVMFECHHGLGHGITQLHRHQTTLLGIKQALDMSSFPGAHTHEAWNGIWMDHFASASISGHTVEDPVLALSICNDKKFSKGRGSSDCWLYAPTGFLMLRPKAYVEALEWCRQGCEKVRNCRSTCVHGVGMQTFKENLDDISVVERVCSKAGSPQLSSNCVRGAAGYYYFAKGRHVPREVCATLRTPDFQRACQR